MDEKDILLGEEEEVKEEEIKEEKGEIIQTRGKFLMITRAKGESI